MKEVYKGANEDLKKLRKFTKECREDMHEPDEQGITARVVGKYLDNAFGENTNPQIAREYIVILRNDDGERFKINLATLIALARRKEE